MVGRLTIPGGAFALAWLRYQAHACNPATYPTRIATVRAREEEILQVDRCDDDGAQRYRYTASRAR
jgi:hypothetical protein